jgi:predicted outer membrane protein
MSALFRLCIGSLAAGLCCTPLGNAVAQQSPASPQTLPAQTQSNPDATNPSNRSDQATSPRLNPPSLSQPTLGPRPYTANYGAQANEGQHNGVEYFFANCLLKNNQAEIEISQYAAQQSQNPKVKQYAEELVKDHQKVVQQLQQIAAANSHHAGATSLDTAAQSDANRLATDATQTPGSSGPATAENPTATRSPAMHGGGALMQVAQIEEKINDRCNQALREELQQKSGAEFDECYLGAQIAGHMHMLAALEVIPQESQGQLKQIAEEAKPTVQKHLDQAKDLMKQAKNGSENANQAERTSTTRENR